MVKFQYASYFPILLALNGLKMLMKYNVDIMRATCVLKKQNINQIEEIVDDIYVRLEE